jgi:hypothetical protein
MELGEMNNIRQHCMKAHFKEDGELGEMHNDLDGKNLQRVKSNVISRQCNQKDGPAPWIVSLLADRDVGVTLCMRRIGNLSLLNFWILDPMFLALLSCLPHISPALQ